MSDFKHLFYELREARRAAKDADDNCARHKTAYDATRVARDEAYRSVERAREALDTAISEATKP